MSESKETNNIAAEEVGEKDAQMLFSRRNFLKLTTATVAVTAVGCDTAQQAPPAPTGLPPFRPPVHAQYPEVPYAPAVPPTPGQLRFFTPHEARTVEAFTARLLPGTPQDPGAREAGVVYYVDFMLSHEDGFVEPVYRQAPFAESYEGDTPPATLAATYQDIIWVPEDEIERYGYQSIYNPREVMRLGLAALDRYTNEQLEEAFVDLTEAQQDSVIEAMVEGEATGFEPLSGETLFQVLRRYTAEGMFSDPAYGGNQNFAGWKLIGFPGAQRAYTPNELVEEGSGLRRQVWGMSDLPHFHPGEAVGPNVVLPVTGSEQEYRHR